MKTKKIIQNTLFLLSILILFYTYYYLPGQYSKVIKIENQEVELDKKIENKKAKNTFTNTEYTSENNKGQIYTTKTKESYIYQDQPELIYLIEPYSFTKLKKDQSLIEINSKTGQYNKEKKITSYNNNVIIKNKNYLITADNAIHYSEKNIIFINGNVIMKDLTLGLSHIAYCDIVEINTLTNDAVAYMNRKDDKVVAKKFK